jgi:type I restriction-modification system DNA methylase subunit
LNKTELKNFAVSAKSILTIHSESIFKTSVAAANGSLFCFLRFIKEMYLKANNIPFGLAPLSGKALLLWEKTAPLLEHEAKNISPKTLANPECLGRLYQYYNKDTKDKIFQNLQKNIRISKDTLAPATQIFTPNWIAKYLVDTSFNSLDKDAKVQNIKLCDPCMGAGHMLLCAFDRLLMEYEKAGIPAQRAARAILENNLFGMDIDGFAVDLAKFSLLMKAWEHDKSILNENLNLNLIEIKEDEFEFKNAKELGSLLQIDAKNTRSTFRKQVEILGQKYHIVITNPPYMGRKSLNETISTYIDSRYPLGKSELYSAFILACLNMLEHGGVCAMITIHSWLFIRSFAKLRRYILDNTAIISMLHTGAATFEEISSYNALAVAFCLKRAAPKGPCEFIRLTQFRSPREKQANMENPAFKYYVNQQNFKKMPDCAFVYHVGEKVREAFYKQKPLKDFSPPKQGLATGDNKAFLRLWHEVDFDKIAFNCENIEEFHKTGKKYAPYNKGGEFRKWYGNCDWVIAFDKESYKKLASQGNRLPSRQYYFKEGITWSLFGFENFAVRYKEKGFVFDVSGSSMFPGEKTNYILAFLSSKVAFLFLSSIAPTVNFQVGDIGSLPLIIDEKYEKELAALVEENIEISKADWDSRESSWNFTTHPLAKPDLLANTFAAWEKECMERYRKLKANEERINEIFIEIYGLQKELPPHVDDRDIALLRADKKGDIISLLSYMIGCAFGRFEGEKNDFLTLSQVVDELNVFIEEKLGFKEENKAFILSALGKTGSFNEEMHRFLKHEFFKYHFKSYKKRPIYWQIKSKGLDGFLYIHNFGEKTVERLRPYVPPSVYQRLKALKINLDDGIEQNFKKFFECFNE